MHTTELELEIVTPMFLHGHDSDLLELRPPAFKSLFRYWWRAAQVITSKNTLRREEGKLFGDTRQGSPLRMRILGQRNLEPENYQPLPHHIGGQGCNNCPRGKRCKKGYTKKAYCPDQQFKIILTASRTAYYASISKLSFLLGGIGNRSRRGFGSIRCADWNFRCINELEEKVYQTLEDISPTIFNRHSHTIQVNSPPAPRLPKYPTIRTIYFGQLLSSSTDDLLTKIGQATHDNNHNALGNDNPRMASPIHVRIQKVSNKYVPIVTQLHWNYPGYTSADLTRQQSFIDQIIS